MRSSSKSIALFGGIIASLTACIAPVPEGTVVHLNQSYGTHNRNKLDMYLPEVRDTATETVLLIHGGAWVSGDKGNADLMNRRDALLEAGYAVASMNYRYANGDYNNQMEDVADAIALIRSEADGWQINQDRFALMGVSAGGHISLLYGHEFDTENGVRTVVSIVGPTDLTDDLFRTYASNYQLLWTMESLLGASLSEDPAIYAEASPLFQASDVPTFFIHGEQDDLVPHEQGIAMFDTLVANGVPADTTIPAQGTHNVNGPSNMYRDQISNEIINWFGMHLDM